MTAIKKAFQPIVSLLQANPDVKVKTLMDQVLELATAKSAGGGDASTFHKDANGNVVAIRCYYHQLWMNPAVAEFGKKTGSASGYNTMCKDGLSKWNKQQTQYKNGKDALLDQVAKGEVQVADIAARTEELEAARKAIIPREDGYGFATLEECLADNAQRGL